VIISTVSGPERDPSLDTLLGLDGQAFFIDEDGSYWVKFEVRTCAVSPQRPHGIKYSLTLHGPKGERLVGFDNAHAMQKPADATRGAQRKHDHKHRLRTIRPYDYRDAATLLADFWKDVDDVLHELGFET
jgi:hypothetical protein